MQRQYHKWYSDNLGRDMELLVFGHAGAKVLVFPAREGRFYDYENWGMVNALRHAIDGGYIRLFCVDGVDSECLYCRHVPPPSRVKRYRQYECYILREAVPFMRSENGVPSLIVHGCSIGAYHAMNLALRHPSLFCKVVALSGRYDLTRSFGHFEDLFSGHYDENVYFITPNHFLPNLTDHALLEPLRQMEITLAVGEEDPFQESNRILSRALADKDVPHHLAIWPGEAHRARYWREMVPHYL
ncbi:MAG TPA: alpha/beta hydrolase-fold protein [Bryobacteraceae bacterium]